VRLFRKVQQDTNPFLSLINYKVKGPRYIENENLPLDFYFEREPQFFVHKIEREGKTATLHYFAEGLGRSIYFYDYQKFEELPSKVEVASGGWYGDKGRWTPLEKYDGTILCKGVSVMKKISDKGVNFKFKVRKPFISRYKILTIESENVGVVEIECRKISPQPFKVFLFDKIKNEWIPGKDMKFN
jgi:hypothetical protein